MFRVISLNANGIRAVDPKRFIEWLDTHEISATRAFGIRVTTKRMAEAVGVVGSLLIAAGTLLVQKQLQIGLVAM